MFYNSLPLTSKLFQLTTLSFALALAGCGGGDGGTDILPPRPDLGVQSGNDGTGLAVDDVNITPITLTNSNGNMTNIVTSAGANATVKVTDNLGVPLSNALVSFAGEGVTFGTSNATVLTNENGEASISVRPIDSITTGSYQITATANYNEFTVTTPGYNFSLQSVNVSLTNIALSSSNLQSGASTNITLKTRDATNNVNQNGVTVDFDTTCGTFDSNSVVSSNQGDITVTYNSIDADGNLCEGNQTITATPASNTSGRKTISVNIASIRANSVVYTTNGNVQLGASNSGSSSSGQITFTVFANGSPAANQQVVISKVFAPADFSFVTLGNQTSRTVTSDSQGRVTVNLYPGALPGPVEIRAALQSNTNVFALSKSVSVATGRATQNGLSISLSKNVLANGIDGDTATITASLVDRVGNPVPNGTVVSFVSEGGRVTPNCATSNGVCTVGFSTQNPRPTDSRVSVIAFVEGDKSYIDTNANNRYDIGVDTLSNNIGNFFRDDNENNQYDSSIGEFLFVRGNSGTTCGSSTFSQPNVFGTCNNSLSAILRSQFVLGLASDTPTFSGLPSTLTAPAGTSGVFQIYGNSARTVSMASGTTISVAGEGDSCAAEIINGNLTVPDIVNLRGGTGSVSPNDVSYRFTYEECSAGDTVRVTVQTPAPSATTTTTIIDVI